MQELTAKPHVPPALVRTLPLALALGAFGWGLLAAVAYGVYLLSA